MDNLILAINTSVECCEKITEMRIKLPYEAFILICVGFVILVIGNICATRK